MGGAAIAAALVTAQCAAHAEVVDQQANGFSLQEKEQIAATPDKVYAAQAEATAQALQAAGAKHIYLAGRPGEKEAALRAAGVNDFIVAGGDALTVLQEAWRRME